MKHPDQQDWPVDANLMTMMNATIGLGPQDIRNDEKF